MSNPHKATDPVTLSRELGVPGLDHPLAAEAAGGEASANALSSNFNIQFEAKMIARSLKELFDNKRTPSHGAIVKIIEGQTVTAQEAQFKDIRWLTGYVEGWMHALT